VLVVEDSRVEGQSLVHALEAEGLRARHVGCAIDAFEVLNRHRFACIIVDLGLPDMDGLEFLKNVRDRPDVEPARLIVHTGRALTKNELCELEGHADAVVLKGERSTERLIDEVKLFIHHLNKTLGTESAANDPPVHVASLVGKKLLLVDDDMRTVYALSAFLRGKGAEVIVADTGIEALAQIERQPDTDAILMDVMMPEMDGYTAMARIRAQPRFAQLPIVALTARAMKGERERCLHAGATDYLPKPVDGGDLLRALSKWLDLELSREQRRG
jgi:CheY-like chemotaxis protein